MKQEETFVVASATQGEAPTKAFKLKAKHQQKLEGEAPTKVLQVLFLTKHSTFLLDDIPHPQAICPTPFPAPTATTLALSLTPEVHNASPHLTPNPKPLIPKRSPHLTPNP
jgi:hypothetical protein